MTTRYRIIPHIFDMPVFAKFLKENIPADEMAEYAAIIGVDRSTLDNWMRLRYQKFAHPTMTNFLYVCNLLDVSPCMFFSLEEDTPA